jgi:hypothetical protein
MREENENKQATPVSEETKEADLQERIDSFNRELRPILGKYELGLTAMAFITPEGKVKANPTLVSMRGKQGSAETKEKEEAKSQQPEEPSEITNPNS